MNPQKVTAQQLFTMQCRYLVPLYQRQYVWNENDQLKPLWEDVLSKTLELMRPNIGRQPRKHFMGAVVLRGLVASGLEYQTYEVIDGQQRLTTLQLLLLALRDYATSKSLQTVTTILNGMTENPPLGGREYERWKVVPTTRDRADYDAVWESKSPAKLLEVRPRVMLVKSKRAAPRPHLIGAYEYFSRAIKGFAETNEQLEDDTSPTPDLMEITRRVELLVRAITMQLELVRIDLDQDDDPQVIFETLNARGARLLPGDLVRNFLFLEATRQFQTQAEVEKLYKTYWLQYDDTESAGFWKAEVRQGRFSTQRFELFLFHFLTSQLRRPDEDIQLGYLYQAFGDWWKRETTGNVEQVLQTLLKYSVFYRRLVEPTTKTDRVALFGRRLRTMDLSTIYPLLLFLFVEREEQTKAEADGIVSDLESYLVRRVVCGLPAQALNRVFLKMATELRQLTIVGRDEVRNYLLSLSGPTAEWPTDSLFRHRWLTTAAYNSLSKPRIRMVLEAVEWQQYTKFQESARPTLDSATIEHILPQSPTDNEWPLDVAQDADDESRELAQQLRYDLTHTFGNLTLVTSPLNSSLSNSAFSIKEQELSSQSTLMLNRYFKLYNIKEWNTEAITVRGERLFEIATDIWPRPVVLAISSEEITDVIES
ncbi:DUF262 domain-containing protein [Hymenobacter guriensis]|uniref:DUF262 domain-containing protein n=1 Tax=Hymenobacter guriensis TaxID=2793065 RepID=A0ABS0L1J8_9BACT|nr:DUF262 domain-containing protein [Hymenobacter guriensis]MBG8553990.1 DUF262 domain-containing protein [Hymenobacter guriensis]